MAYQRAISIVRLALLLHRAARGMTLDDVQAEFKVSRRTAERLRDAVEEVFGPLERVETGESKYYWRLPACFLRGLISLGEDEIGRISRAAKELEGKGCEEYAALLRHVADRASFTPTHRR